MQNAPIPKSDYLIPAGLTVVALIPALAGTVRLVGLAQGAPSPQPTRISSPSPCR